MGADFQDFLGKFITSLIFRIAPTFPGIQFSTRANGLCTTITENLDHILKHVKIKPGYDI